jgi:hypothetical protein
LRNPLYNGWIRRHRGAGETRRPAAWRSNPPVSDELWARVEDVRRRRRRAGDHAGADISICWRASSNASAGDGCAAMGPSAKGGTASSTSTPARRGDRKRAMATRRGRYRCSRRWPD